MMAQLPGPHPPPNVRVPGNLLVEGKLVCRGVIDSDIFKCINTVIKDQDARIAELHKDRTALQKRLAKLEEQFEVLWLAPGMPGALTQWRPSDLFGDDEHTEATTHEVLECP